MQQASYRCRTPVVVLALLLVISVGAGAIGLIELPPLGNQPISVDEPVSLFEARYAGFANTGFSLRSVDGSLLTLLGESQFDPTAGLQAGQTVQEGFVLLDGTLSVDIAAFKFSEDRTWTRARFHTTYRLNIPRRSLRRENVARALFRQGLVRDLDRGMTRARKIDLDDARVMRLVEGREGRARWVRAVRALRSPERMRFRPRTEPTGVLGHFGTAMPGTGDPYVWAVMDRNSRYAVGLTVDRDNDGVPNATDNCIGTANSNQSNADDDGAGDACDVDDDNDSVADTLDNCPLTSNGDQRDHDADRLGDACDFDDDNDAVADGLDKCLTTAPAAVVDATGCSIADQCPCESEWRNHGAYVKCVARTSELFATLGLITPAQKDATVSAGAQSVCGGS